MTAPPLVSDIHRLGAGLSVRFTLAPDRVEVEWTPRRPTAGEFQQVRGAYRSARDTFLAAVSAQTGKRVLLVELPG